MSKPTIHPPLAAAAWPVVREWAALNDLCTGVFDCPHTTPQLTEDGPFVVRSQDVRSGVFRLEHAGRVSAATYRERIARAEPTFGDILYSREGTYFGNAAEVPAGVQVCLGQRMVLIKPRREAVDSRFLTFWLNSPILKEHILGFRDGSVAERLNMPTIRNIPVPLVPMSEQRCLGEVLGTLNDKIELNRRINVTLDAMARAIFRDWFVDFGPVRRKLAGETDPVAIMGGLTVDPARAAELAALFPDGMGSADVPESWSFEPFGRFFKLERGLSYKGSALSERGKPLINLGCFSGAGGFNVTKLKYYTGDHKARHTAAPGTLLIANTDITQDRVILGSPHIVDAGSFNEEPLFSHHVYAARRLSTKAWERFFFYHLMEPAFRDRAAGFATGTTVLALPKDAVEAAEFAVPPEAVLDAFLDIVRPFLDRARVASAESRTLAETRDYLLPRLMSGEVRMALSDIESAAA